MDIAKAIVVFLSAFRVVDAVVSTLRDRGRQSVERAATSEVSNRVESGHLASDMATAIVNVLPHVLDAHPSVAGCNLAATPLPSLSVPFVEVVPLQERTPFTTDHPSRPKKTRTKKGDSKQ